MVIFYSGSGPAVVLPEVALKSSHINLMLTFATLGGGSRNELLRFRRIKKKRKARR